MLQQFAIRGVARRQGDSGPETLRILAFDLDLRSEEFLGEATPDREGRFEILYTPDQFRRGEKKTADLILRASDTGNDAPLAIRELEVNGRRREDATAAIHNVPAECEVVLVIEPVRRGERSEYETYLEDAAPVLQSVAWVELTREDLAFLVADLELDAEQGTHLDWIRAAAILGSETGVAAEAFYAWARTPHPDRWRELLEVSDRARAEMLRRIQDELTATADDELVAMLERAADARWVPVWVRDRAAEIVRALKYRGYARSR